MSTDNENTYTYTSPRCNQNTLRFAPASLLTHFGWEQAGHRVG